MKRHWIGTVSEFLVLAVMASRCPAQQLADTGAQPVHPESKRILGLVPNFRTAPFPNPYQPLSAREKFKIASEDSFDRGTIALGLIFGAEAQWMNSNPAFGDGLPAYARYAATSYVGFVIGDYMTEAIYPTLLHQDPRYFRRGVGGARSRLGYSLGQIFWTHTDSGGMQFNYSEIAGNATEVAISQIYYQNGRTVHDAAQGLAIQVGVDAASNVLKEFWPDLQRKLRRHPRNNHWLP